MNIQLIKSAIHSWNLGNNWFRVLHKNYFLLSLIACKFSPIMHSPIKRQMSSTCQVLYWGNTCKQDWLGPGPVGALSLGERGILNRKQRGSRCYSESCEVLWFCWSEATLVFSSKEQYWLFLEILELEGNLDLVQFLILQVRTFRSREVMCLS